MLPLHNSTQTSITNNYVNTNNSVCGNGAKPQKKPYITENGGCSHKPQLPKELTKPSQDSGLQQLTQLAEKLSAAVAKLTEAIEKMADGAKGQEGASASKGEAGANAKPGESGEAAAKPSASGESSSTDSAGTDSSVGSTEDASTSSSVTASNTENSDVTLEGNTININVTNSDNAEGAKETESKNPIAQLFESLFGGGKSEGKDGKDDGGPFGGISKIFSSLLGGVGKMAKGFLGGIF